VTDDDVDLNLNAFMKNNNAHAVAFNLDTGRWQFATPVHRQAVVCVAGPVVRAHAHASCLLCCVFLFVCLSVISCNSVWKYSVYHGSWGGAPMQPSVLIDGHRVMSWNAYVLLRRCSGRSDGEGNGCEGGGGGGSEGGSEGGRGGGGSEGEGCEGGGGGGSGGRGGGGSKGAGSSGKGELHVRWMCVEVVAGAVAAVVAVVVSWNVDFVLL
jgi:hypothetical protein